MTEPTVPSEPTPPPPAASPPTVAPPTDSAVWQADSAVWQGPDPEPGPAPGVEFATPGSRLVAYIVDVLIQFGLFIALLFATGILLAIFWPLGFVAGLAATIFLFVYFPYFWQKSGQTPGMKLMGIKVVRDKDGGPIGWGSAILRLIGYYISGAVFYIGYIWIFVDKRKRGWHDLIASTVVVKAPNDLSS
jgi:uncharacterized RDD family membrane protein YckC